MTVKDSHNILRLSELMVNVTPQKRTTWTALSVPSMNSSCVRSHNETERSDHIKCKEAGNLLDGS